MVPAHAVLTEAHHNEIDLKWSTVTTALSYLCTAALTVKNGCLTNGSLCSTMPTQLLGKELSLTSFGFLFTREEDC